MTGFTEASLENVIVNAIADKGFEHVRGDQLSREYEDVLLEDDLRAFLQARYAVNGIADAEIDQIIRSLHTISITPLYDANRTTFLKIVEGENFIRLNRSQKDFYLQMIDFDYPENNIFKVCNQVIIKGPQQKRIPDTIVYINGLPMIVWEYKSTVKPDTTIYDAFEQITIRYTRDIPELFKYNAFVVISDGVNSKMGSIFSAYEHFYAWRKVNDDDEEANGIGSLRTMIDGLFTKERLISYIRDFIYFPDSGSKTQMKICASYPQFFAANKLHESVLAHKKPHGDGKGGTYFGTTGCGKSYAMLFLTRILMRDIRMSSPTIILITDRTDLDDQLSNCFVDSKKFIGDSEVVSVLTRDDLKEKLKDKASGGVYLTTIQKFTDALNLLTDRDNVVCISDEAHRSQLNLDETITIRDNEVRTTFGYAKYLHDSLPNATYIGFTGTPIQETIDVFGGVVESYTMRDSIRDGITVRLVYDGRFAKAVLDTKKMQRIEAYYKKCLQQGANEYQVEESKKETVNMRAIIGDKDVLTKVAENFIEHYESRVREGSTVAGKAMFVCADRFIAWDFYKIVKSMRPEWAKLKKHPDGIMVTEDEERKLLPMPMIKMVMTRGKNDPKELYDMLGTDADREADAIQFKDIHSNFKIAIVVDMWLTGFDVPFLDTMYIDKLLVQQHNIIQTISRVNRAYQGKDYGLIVDFIGIKYGMDLALKKYAKYDPDDIEGIGKAIDVVRDELEVLDAMLCKFDSTRYFSGTDAEKLQTLNQAAEFVQVTKEFEQRFMQHVARMSKAFRLCNASRDFSDKELGKIHYYMAVRAIIHKLVKRNAPDVHQMNKVVSKMIQDAVSANDVEVLFSTERDFNSSAIDMFSEEYIKKIDAIQMPNTKIRILQQLLNQAIEDFGKVNKIRAATFSEKLQAVVNRYNMRALTDDEINEILNSVATDMINLLGELRAEKQSFQKLGIDYEEKAFYDILVEVEEKYQFSYPEDQNIALAKEIHSMVTDKTKYADWANRQDIRAELQADIIVMLAQHGFPAIPKGTMPPEDYQKIYDDVIDQTENFKKYYNQP
ncbi:MAG: HsdR family type I site-specific deoxyribonuclease [Lachnospiraceae bacterium]|jgi:type I restriction enzyme R subunit|nr:HsdR family type I site-specific deoxyribonuclease [Lachnospiraceae bacterium]MCH4062931.1 HsdR family type I site-specific deoxyribonuclease [Lachnospiraceae bacterium]MCH4104237.1 HsdR family type I site-specific deoxyribonuclease [Lachnospiraceae bacterium]MCI1309102.1 HsdR family type I site-specific deoxyribonuclease [Lachnospiraceae bacterium]MCI1356986.1 HsdR family type I site-specific deoxyribonuclease [Lachnospiraceae bacterium]